MFRYKLNKEKIKDNYKSIQGVSLNAKDWLLSKICLVQLKSFINQNIVIEEELNKFGKVISSTYRKEIKNVAPVLQKEEKVFAVREQRTIRKNLIVQKPVVKEFTTTEKAVSSKKEHTEKKEKKNQFDIDLNKYTLNL